MDISYLLFLQSLRETTNGVFNKFFSYVTGYGEMANLFVLFAIVYWCINKKTGEFMLLSLAFSRIINGLLKIIFCVYRPWIRDARVLPLGDGLKTATGYSFPSGHTTNATACFGSYAISSGCKKTLSILLWLFAILIAFSRNYIGVHTPQDVVVAFITTTLITIGMEKLYTRYSEKPYFTCWVTGSGLFISILVLLYTAFKGYPMDYDTAGKLIVDPAKMVLDSYKNLGYVFGILIGIALEKSFINFSTEGTTEQKITRFLLCFLLFQVLSLVLIPMITTDLPKETANFIKPFLKTMYICCIAPAIIKYSKI